MIGLDPDYFCLSGRSRRDQPPGARRSGRFRPLPWRSARCAESAARRIADRDAALACRRCRRASSAISATTWCRRMERLSRTEPPDRGTGGASGPSDCHGGFRQGERQNLAGDAGWSDARGSARAAYESAVGRLDGMVDVSNCQLDQTAPTDVDPLVKAGEVRSNTTEAEYWAMVARAKDYIPAGDTFQIVLSQRFTRRFDLPPFALYRAMRLVNPSPFSLLSRLRRLLGGGLQS